MNIDMMHPADRIVLLMNRIYSGGLTTMSGGNLSIRESNGDLWVTPGGIDKGSLTAATLSACTLTAARTAISKPTSELTIPPGHLQCLPGHPGGAARPFAIPGGFLHHEPAAVDAI